MNTMRSVIRWFVDGEDGAAAVEYAVMLALIIVVCVAVIGGLGVKVKDVCETVCMAIGRNPS